MAKCNPKCNFTASIRPGPDGGRLMVSQAGGKFPLGFVHPMCPECIEAQNEEMNLALFFDNDQKAIKRYKEVLAKAKRALSK
jgi:hypothetical protein